MKSLDSIDQELRHPFVKFIDSISETQINNINWWCSELAARHTLDGSLYEDCLRLIQIKNQVTENNNFHITLNDKALYKTLLKNLEPHYHIQVHYKKKLISSFKRIALHWLRYGNLIYQISKRFLAAKFIPNSKFSPTQPLTLIDMFIFDHSFDAQNHYKDRYYGRLKEFLTPEEKEIFFYMPTFQTSSNQTISAIKKCRQSPDNFLLSEDFLKFPDLFYIWTYPFRAWKFFPKKNYKLLDLDISQLIKKHWWQGLTYGSTYEGLLKYRFVKRLKEKNIPVRLVIDWFENQNIDKGQNAGFRKFYPEVPIIGYQGYIGSNQYSNRYVSPTEFKAEITPTFIAVCGPEWKAEYQTFCSEINIINSPAFRFNFLYQYSRQYKKELNKKLQVLILLNLELEDTKVLLQMISQLLHIPISNLLEFSIRPHPAMRTIEKILKDHELINRESIKIDRHSSFLDSLLSADICIGSSSSTLMESVCLGTSVIILSNPKKLTTSVIPDSIDTRLWSICETVQELKVALELKLNPKPDWQVSASYCNALKEKYFTPTTAETARSFLKLPAT